MLLLAHIWMVVQQYDARDDEMNESSIGNRRSVDEIEKKHTCLRNRKKGEDKIQH